jgi:hypothetical protein
VLSDIYFDRNQKSPQWPLILEAMARTEPRTASHMLAQGIEQLQNPKLIKPLKLADGSEIPAGTFFSAALEKVRKISYARQARSLPTFHLPFPQDYKKYPKPFLPNGPVIANVDALAVPLRDFRRPDRIVAWSSAAALTVYAPGGDKPLGSSQFPEQPRGCAWLDKNLLVWGDTKLALLKDDGATLAWTMDLGRLAPIEVIATDQPAAAVEPPNVAVMNARIRANNVFIRQGGRVAIRGIQPVAAPAAKAVQGGPEQIEQVLPVGDRILLGTTFGRVGSIDSDSGRLAWQTRLTDRPIDRLLADEDFTVIKAEDDASVHLAVLDTYSGHVRGSRSYRRDTNSYPQNIALSPDGTLVYTLPDRVCLKDLYRPWDQKEIEKQAAPGQASFMGLGGPDQLIISENRILALTDSGTGDRGPGEKFVRLYSLETGEPMMLNVADGQQVEKALSIGSKSPDVVLRVVGPRVYMIAPDAAICYNLENPEDHYQMFDQESEGMGAQLAFIGQDYLVLLNGAGAEAAANAPPAPAVPRAEQPAISPSYMMYAFSRKPQNGRESGRLDYSTSISSPAGITSSWQPMEGGLVYVTADHKLHMLIGAREGTPRE